MCVSLFILDNCAREVLFRNRFLSYQISIRRVGLDAVANAESDEMSFDCQIAANKLHCTRRIQLDARVRFILDRGIPTVGEAKDT